MSSANASPRLAGTQTVAGLPECVRCIGIIAAHRPVA